ncbi:class II aldolase/adducin family protein [Candidatus Bipolaricaulota bacterium]|nr:class II aldolase/adducin family protein [Candidatus Bipolaricaulota bacterium]
MIGEPFSASATGGKLKVLLMKQHGVFTAGPTPQEALKAAVTVEHAARVSYLAESWGGPAELSAEEGKKLYDKYMKNYGQ